MIITLELTSAQVDEIAARIAAKLGTGKETLSTREAAARIGKSRDTVLRMVKAGILPKLPGSSIRIPTTAVDRHVQKTLSNPT